MTLDEAIEVLHEAAEAERCDALEKAKKLRRRGKGHLADALQDYAFKIWTAMEVVEEEYGTNPPA